jgi:hypothetical protein
MIIMTTVRGIDLVVVVFIVFKLIVHLNAFNISPNPNLIVMQPVLNTFQPQTRSSYFGYSLNLRKTR